MKNKIITVARVATGLICWFLIYKLYGAFVDPLLADILPSIVRMVLMSMRAKVPIVPVYVREHKPRSSGLRVVIGEPIDINKMYAGRPSMSDIEAITNRLFEKENELKAIAFQR